MPDGQRLLRQVRSAFVIDRFDPDLAAGCRMGVIVAVPLVAGAVAGRIDIATLMTLGALNVGLADPGGPYDVRVRATSIATLTMTVAVLLGTLVAASFVAGVATLAIWVFVMTLASGLGPTAPGISFVSSVMYVIALGLPPDSSEAGFRVAWFVVGCGWAVVVTSSVWPLRRDAPGRSQLVATFAMIADFLRQAPHDDAGRAAARDRIATATAAARTAVGHSGHHGGRGRRLLLALDAAEDVERALGALDRALEGARPVPASISDAVAALADACDGLASNVRGDDPTTAPRLDGAMEALAAERLDGDEALARDVLRFTVESLAVSTPEPTAPTRRRPWIDRERLHSLLDVHSLLFRHATRMAVVVAAAQALAFVDPYEKSYWIPLTAVVVLKPDLGSTFTRGVQRLAGTILGLLIAFSVVTLGDDREWPLIVGFVLVVGLMGAVWELNYALAVAALTPAVILLLSVDGGGPGLEVARLGGTLVGGGLAFVGGLLLWPVWERSALAPALAAGAAGQARYLEQVVDPACAVAEVRAAHSEAERARADVEGVVERMLSEPQRNWIAPTDATAYCTRLQTLVESTTELRVAWREQPAAADREGGDDRAAVILEARIARSVAALDAASGALRDATGRHRHPTQDPAAGAAAGASAPANVDLDAMYRSRDGIEPVIGLLMARIERATSALGAAADRVAVALAASRGNDAGSST